MLTNEDGLLVALAFVSVAALVVIAVAAAHLTHPGPREIAEGETGDFE